MAIKISPFICTFVDFKKAYDSIDRQTLLNILEERGHDDKTQRLIKQALFDTTSKSEIHGRNLGIIRDQNRSQTRIRTVAFTVQPSTGQSTFVMGQRTEKTRELGTKKDRTSQG